MSVTRRRLCALLPAVLAPTVLIPAILPAEANAHEGNVLPTAMYPFEKLTPRTSNSAVIRATSSKANSPRASPWKSTRPLCLRAELPTRRTAISTLKCG